MYVFIFFVKVTEWPPIGKIAAHSAYDMFSWYKYLIVSCSFFSTSVFWSGNLFLIAHFPDLCLLVPFDRGNGSLYKRSISHYQDGRLALICKNCPEFSPERMDQFAQNEFVRSGTLWRGQI